MPSLSNVGRTRTRACTQSDRTLYRDLLRSICMGGHTYICVRLPAPSRARVAGSASGRNPRSYNQGRTCCCRVPSRAPGWIVAAPSLTMSEIRCGQASTDGLMSLPVKSGLIWSSQPRRLQPHAPEQPQHSRSSRPAVAELALRELLHMHVRSITCSCLPAGAPW